MSYEDYQEGYRDGQRSYKSERARRTAYNNSLAEGIDRLIRYYDPRDERIAAELRAIASNYHHPSNIWKMEAVSG